MSTGRRKPESSEKDFIRQCLAHASAQLFGPTKRAKEAAKQDVEKEKNKVPLATCDKKYIYF